MASLSFALSLAFVLVVTETVLASVPGQRFTVTHEVYGYLHGDGDILWFAWTKQRPTYFTFLRNNAIQETRSKKCIHASTNGQLVLKRKCDGDDVLLFANVDNQRLVERKSKKCLSVWPAPKQHLANLDKCSDSESKLIIRQVPVPRQRFTVTHEVYGYLHGDGDILWFAWTKQRPTYFSLLRNNAIQERMSRKCIHASTNGQLVLKTECDGDDVLLFKIIGHKWLVDRKSKTCLSVGLENYLAGLNKCADPKSKMIIAY